MSSYSPKLKRVEAQIDPEEFDAMLEICRRTRVFVTRGGRPSKTREAMPRAQFVAEAVREKVERERGK